MISYQVSTARFPVAALMAAAGILLAETAAAEVSPSVESTPPSSVEETGLSPGEEGAAVIRDITVQGEDRIQIEFDRPSLELDFQTTAVPGLELVTVTEILERCDIDLVRPMVEQSVSYRTPYLGRPWLRCFSMAPVARFHPKVEDVDRWQLTIADSRGKTVAEFRGQGEPPEEIAWDGRSLEGPPVSPGLTYSYALEAYDRAGNKRNFVGEGFRLPDYRLETSDSLFLLFAGDDIPLASLSGRYASETPPIILEAASWLNQAARVGAPVHVKATAQTFEQAQTLGESVSRCLAPLLLGDPLRLRVVTNVEPGAPDTGTVTLVAVR